MSFERISIENYPSDILKYIDLFKLNDNINIIGSLSYSDIRQYADVDLIEKVDITDKCTSFDYYNAIIACIDRMKHNGAKYADIKCGTIEKYKIITKYYGYLENSKVYDFDYNQIKNYLNSIKINQQLKDDILLAANKYETSHMLIDYENFVEYIRNLYTVHWSEQEIRQFTKAGPSAEVVNIMDHIFNEPLKIDMLIPINDNWIEISNIHNLSQNGVPVNFNPMTKKQIYKSIAENAEKLFFSPLFHSAYKAIKRCWILARLNDDEKNGSIFAKLINSDINNAYIVKSYIATFCIMIVNHEIVDLSKSKQNIKWLLSHVTSIDIPQNIIDRIDVTKTEEDYINIMHEISDLLNEYTKKWIISNKMMSIIQHYLYSVKNYEHNIII